MMSSAKSYLYQGYHNDYLKSKSFQYLLTEAS